MEFRESFQYPAGIDRVWQMLSDPQYAADRAKVLEMTNPEVSSDAHENKVQRVTTGGVPQEMLPAAAKRFISPTTKVEIKELWERRGDNRIHGRMEVVGKGVPAGLHADVDLVGNGDVTDATMKGDLKISIPLLGRRLEKEAIGFAPMLAQGEVDNAKQWLAKNK